MAGAASDLGQTVLSGALVGILGALTADQRPVQQPVPVAPSIERPAGLGIPTSTLLLAGVGIFVVVQLLK